MNTRKGQTSPNVSSKEKKPKGKIGVHEIDYILSLAEYEVDIDSYRGITNTSVLSPWFKCRRSDRNDSHVFQVFGCACPSLVDWSKKNYKFQKKRKISEGHNLFIGRRPQECINGLTCDFNPVSSMFSLTS
jgi:hypothetical protein